MSSVPMKTRDTAKIDELVTLMIKSLSSAGVEKFTINAAENGFSFEMSLSGVWYRKQMHFNTEGENE